MNSPGTPSHRRRDGDDAEYDSDESRQTSSTLRRSPRPASDRQPSIDAASTHNLPPPPTLRSVTDVPGRHSPVTASPSTFASHFGAHRRQRSQGYFEPTLPSNQQGSMANLSASQIAAQAAMHVQKDAQHIRKRSQTIPEHGPSNSSSTSLPDRAPQAPPPTRPTVNFAGAPSSSNVQYSNGLAGGSRMAATTAANAAFPRSPLNSPGFPPADFAPPPALPAEKEKESKPPKEKSKMKLFSKPKHIGISKDKDFDKKNPALPSPGKMAMQSTGALNRMINASTTSLAEPTMSSGSSIYSSNNASTSTLVPTEKPLPYAPEKEKHKHHFLSRQKNKLKDRDDHHLPLSSASSNSKPIDPNAPQSLYNFAAPASPGHAATFTQSKSGLDLRHAGKALRQKKKDEKAAAMAPFLNESIDAAFRDRSHSFSAESRLDLPTGGSVGTTTDASMAAGVSAAYKSNLTQLGATFGIPGMSPDDAWPLLKARLLHIFEGEDPRPPIEDFNSLVSVHLRRCIERRQPITVIEDLEELLQTGFGSLDQTIRGIPDERLVPALVEMWMSVFTTVLPFLQAVFLPLDLEFKGRGSLLTLRDASEFWGAVLPNNDLETPTGKRGIPSLGEELDVRRIILLTFRDTVILPRNDTLTAIFSRLSLENLSTGISFGDQRHNLSSPDSTSTFSNPSNARPGTSTSADHAPSSYTSQGSTLLGAGDTPSSSSPLRSRATSNTSAGSFPSLGQSSPQIRAPPQPMDSSKVTEIVGRMLQCVSVLASVQSGDDAQAKMERLNRELKHNWLGRGRTGRNRRGFIGTKMPKGLPIAS